MEFDSNLLLKIGLMIGGILAVVKGIDEAFISNKSIEQGSLIKLILGFMFMILGVFLIYFADLFPPVTDFLRPFVTGILGLPQTLSSWVENSVQRNL